MAGLRTTGRRAGLDFHFYVAHPLRQRVKLWRGLTGV